MKKIDIAYHELNQAILNLCKTLKWKQHAYDSGYAKLEKKGVPIIKDKT